jgi:hypothetical protein
MREEELYRIKDAAKLLDIEDMSLRQRIDRLHLPVTKVGGKIFVRLSDMRFNCQMCGKQLTKRKHKFCNECQKNLYKSSLIVNKE